MLTYVSKGITILGSQFYNHLAPVLSLYISFCKHCLGLFTMWLIDCDDTLCDNAEAS